jgi:hypothetical protein
VIIHRRESWGGSGAAEERGNEFIVSGYRVLRFPAFAVRCHPDQVAGQIRDALRLGGVPAEAGAIRAGGPASPRQVFTQGR